MAPPSTPTLSPAPSSSSSVQQAVRLVSAPSPRPGMGWRDMLLAVPAIVLIVAVLCGLVLVEARTRITRPRREAHIGQHRAH
ncbi:hypothetical protein ACFYUV_49665 [Nonomuraea sp. NPDC003560]|uniref:hypothetical protein n=1 Tax=Nonomuraea sp. NPDC003560 TaxID=3364341 RepID=UPI0036B9309F